MNSVTSRHDDEFLSIAQRCAELLTVIPMVLVFLFFALHQVLNTGFFTSSFGKSEMVCLYGPMLFTLTVPLVKATIGRRNPARPFEVVSNLFMAAGSLWLIAVFPFDFSHFGDFLPEVFHFPLSFITNGIGMIILALQVVGATIAAIVAAIKFLLFRPLEPISNS